MQNIHDIFRSTPHPHASPPLYCCYICKSFLQIVSADMKLFKERQNTHQIMHSVPTYFVSVQHQLPDTGHVLSGGLWSRSRPTQKIIGQIQKFQVCEFLTKNIYSFFNNKNIKLHTQVSYYIKKYCIFCLQGHGWFWTI